jgi:hypothetical protein
MKLVCTVIVYFIERDAKSNTFLGQESAYKTIRRQLIQTSVRRISSLGLPTTGTADDFREISPRALKNLQWLNYNDWYYMIVPFCYRNYFFTSKRFKTRSEREANKAMVDAKSGEIVYER